MTDRVPGMYRYVSSGVIRVIKTKKGTKKEPISSLLATVASILQSVTARAVIIQYADFCPCNNQYSLSIGRQNLQFVIRKLSRAR